MIVAVLALSFAGQDISREAFTAEKLAAAQTLAPKVREVFANDLYHYSTAKFREVSAVWTDNGEGGYIVFCGLVDAQNRDGSSDGWARFAALEDIIFTQGEFEDRLISLHCAGPRSVADTRDWSEALAPRNAPSPNTPD